MQISAHAIAEPKTQEAADECRDEEYPLERTCEAGDSMRGNVDIRGRQDDPCPVTEPKKHQYRDEDVALQSGDHSLQGTRQITQYHG